MIKNIQKDFITYFFFLTISILFLLVLSSKTSPLFNSIGGDSGIFLMLGRMFLAGKIPYVDFFDHKGPVIIFIEAIGLSLCPGNARTGLFILQTINLTFFCILTYRCCRYFISRINSITVVILSLIIFAFTIQGGNLTEEYSLCFLMFSFLAALDYTFTKNLKKSHIFAVGICAGILFWLRLTNMGILGASLLYMFIISFRTKNRKDTVNLIVYSLSGFLLFSLFIIIYFIKIDALEEMIYAAFTFNFKYINSASQLAPETISDKILHIIKTWSSLLILLLGMGMYFYKNRKTDNIILLAILFFIFSSLTIIIGPGYYHYMTLIIPSAILGLILIFVSLSNDKKRIKYDLLTLTACILILSGYFIAKYNQDYYQETQDDSKVIESAAIISSMIPCEEKNSVYGYPMIASFWAHSGLLPCYKYFIMQEQHAKHEPNITVEINEMMQQNPPVWLISAGRKYSSNEHFWKIVDKDYNLYTIAGGYELYRRKK